MKIIYNSRDIYKDISLNYAVHEMHAGNKADSLALRFNDPKGMWSKWDPQKGDIISLEHKGAKTGKLYIFQTQAVNGAFVIRAMSMPPSMHTRRTASWEKISYTQIVNEIAARHGLTVKLYSIKDQTYESMVQQNETDIAFLNHLSMAEGNQIVIYDGQLVIYDEAEMEKSTAAETIKIGNGSNFSYEDDSMDAYDNSVVFAGTYRGSFSIGGDARTIQTEMRANSNVEASRFAKNILRNANKALQTGSVTVDFTPKYAPASVVNIATSKATKWNGRSFITKVRHDYVRNLTTLFFRNITLEGY